MNKAVKRSLEMDTSSAKKINCCPDWNKLPPFYPSNPLLWFHQVEAQFSLANIWSDDEKFYTLVAKMESHVLEYVTTMIFNPPKQAKYEKLKELIILKYTDFNNVRLNSEVANMPSIILKKLREIVDGQLNEALLKNLWLKYLPKHIQDVLEVIDEDLNNLVIKADIIMKGVQDAEVERIVLKGSVENLDKSVQANVRDENDHALQLKNINDAYMKFTEKFEEFTNFTMQIKKEHQNVPDGENQIKLLHDALNKIALTIENVEKFITQRHNDFVDDSVTDEEGGSITPIDDDIDDSGEVVIDAGRNIVLEAFCSYTSVKMKEKLDKFTYEMSKIGYYTTINDLMPLLEFLDAEQYELIAEYNIDNIIINNLDIDSLTLIKKFYEIIRSGVIIKLRYSEGIIFRINNLTPGFAKKEMLTYLYNHPKFSGTLLEFIKEILQLNSVLNKHFDHSANYYIYQIGCD